MASSLQPKESKVATRHEVEAMACVLEGRHGIHAADVAEFFAATHVKSDDTERSHAWSQVADMVRLREVRRQAGMSR
jgi:hypothetical protein